jgi:hypothetical protein
MDKKTDKKTDKKQLEEILSQEITEDALKVSPFIRRVASSTASTGATTQQNVILSHEFPNHCNLANLLDVGGFATTGNDGKRQLRLTDFICPAPAGENFRQPINIVATPISSAPCFVTVVGVLVNNGADVEIRVSSWDANGAAAPRITFNWRCRVEVGA